MEGKRTISISSLSTHHNTQELQMGRLRKASNRDNSMYYFDPDEIVHVRPSSGAKANVNARQRGSTVCLRNGQVFEVNIPVDELIASLFESEVASTEP